MHHHALRPQYNVGYLWAYSSSYSQFSCNAVHLQHSLSFLPSSTRPHLGCVCGSLAKEKPFWVVVMASALSHLTPEQLQNIILALYKHAGILVFEYSITPTIISYQLVCGGVH